MANNYDISGSGLYAFTVIGAVGGGFVLPVLTAATNIYRGDSSTADISLDGFHALAFGKCLPGCGTTSYPAHFTSQGVYVAVEDLHLLIPFLFDQSIAVPYQYSLHGRGYGPDGWVKLEAWFMFDAEGRQLTNASVVENGFVTPEPSTLTFALVGVLMLALGLREKAQKFGHCCAIGP